MPDLTPTLLPQLQSHRLPGLDLGEGLIHPAYQGLALSSIPASIPGWLGMEKLGGPVQPPLAEPILSALPGEVEQVVLFLVDGLGLLNLQAMLQRVDDYPSLAAWPRLLANGLLAPLTSVALSTTSAALTTLWTAAAPAAHGVLAYELFLKEYSLTANMISHSPASFSGDVGGLARTGFSPHSFLPVARLADQLLAGGVGVYAFQHAAIAHSGLSTMLLGEAEVVPFKNLSDLWVSLEGLLRWRGGQPTYAYAYFGELDELMHRYGPQDERVVMEFAAFTSGFERFLRRLAAHSGGRTRVVLTADHGLIHTPIRPELDLHRHPQFVDHLVMLPSGEARVPFLYVRPGHEDALHAYAAQAWPGRFRLLRSADALTLGLFGPPPVYPPSLARLGDWLLIPQEDDYLFWDGRKENSMRGRHGGFSPEEMLIPLMVFEV